MTLGIYGGGGLGREVLEIAKQINLASCRWDKLVFIDDSEHEGPINGVPAIKFSEIVSAFSREDIQIVVAVGEPAVRKKIYEKVKENGFRFATVIHPSVYIPDTTEIGEGTAICAFSFVSCNTKIGVNSYLQPQTMIGHDCVLGDHTVVSPCAAIAGGCSVGEGTYIGMSALVKEKVKIGAWSIIGMGSEVYRDIEDMVIAIGSPARVVRRNDDKKVFR